MDFWASSETHQPAYASITAVRRCVEPFLNMAFAASSLSTLEGRLRYVPIIMPEGMRERYPARSALHKKERIYDCAPQLDYNVFVEGTFEDQLKEYLHGIAESASHLARLGATPQQIDDFNKIMATAVGHILTERPDLARH